MNADNGFFAALGAGAAILALITGIAMLLLVRRVQSSNRALRAKMKEHEGAQQQMRESRRRLQLLLDHMPDGVLAFDANGRVEWINPAARQIFQRSADDAVGQPVARLVPSIDEAQPVQPAAKVPAGMVAPSPPRLATEGLRRDGSSFPLEVAVVAMQGGGLVVCRDITDAQRMERMQAEFVSMVSHELRTPLTSLRGSLAMLADGSVDRPADVQRLLRLAAANAERLVMLTNDILDFEKLRAGALKVEIEEIELNAAAARAVESIEGIAASAGVRLRVVSREPDLPVRADPARLMQVLGNLLSNAIKYSPAGGTVLISLEQRGEFARLSVRDQGVGVPEEFVPRLFLPFEQARDPRYRKQGGTGLGLAISRALMDRMFGAIGHERPAEGSGAVFWIELLVNVARPSTFGEFDDG